MTFQQQQAAFLVAILSVMPAFAQEDGGLPAPQVQVANAEVRDLAPTFSVSGTVVSTNDSRIATEVDGILAELAEVGTQLAVGDVIARVDPRLLQVRLAKAEAAVARLEADLVFRDRQLERAEGLAKLNNASADLLDEARANRAATFNNLADALADRTRARGDLDRATIRAPFDGHVVQRLAGLGEYVSVGAPIARLVDTHRLEIAAPLPVHRVPFVNPGDALSVESQGVVREASVRTVVPVADPVSRMVEIRLASVDDWLAGTPVQVRVPSAHPMRSVAVPRDALIERGGVRYVYRLADDGTAEQLEPEISAVVGLWVAVGEPIEAGDKVIIRGAERLAPGQAVQVLGGTDSEQKE